MTERQIALIEISCEINYLSYKIDELRHEQVTLLDEENRVPESCFEPALKLQEV